MKVQFKKAISIMSSLLILFSTNAPVFASMPADKAAKKTAVKIPVAPKVKVNRMQEKPRIGKHKFCLSDQPTDMEIARARVFQEPLIPMNGKSSTLETRSLAKALKDFKAKDNPEDLSALNNFVANFPNSRWAPALKNVMAKMRFYSGFLSQALELWQQAFQASKNEKAPAQISVANNAVSHLMLLESRLGRLAELKQLYNETNNRKFLGSDLERVEGARVGIAEMEQRPGKAYKCGPFAVNSVANALKKVKEMHPVIDEAQSTKEGTSLSDIKKLSDQMGLNLAMAKRSKDAPLAVPSVLHWKLGHFAAIVGIEKNRYHIIDPTFDTNSQIWISKEALDSETDGFFLVPLSASGKLPKGFIPINDNDAKLVKGKGVAIDWWGDKPHPEHCMSNKCSSCEGMAQAAASHMLCALMISDTPLAYDPPVGPSIDISLSYQDLQTNQPGSFSFTNMGQNWNLNWLSYLSVDMSNVATVRLMGGGSEVFTPTMSGYLPDFQSQAVLVDVGGGVFERHLTDGTIQVFDLSDGGSPANIFMTKMFDPQGNRMDIYYDADFRLVAIADNLGQATLINYVTNTFGNPGFYQPATITDPFSRSCSFSYDATYSFLTGITDVMGMQSKFTYDPGSSFISSLTTPYGTTSFHKYVPGSNPNPARGLKFTFPDGSTSVLEAWVGLPESSYFWDRHAMELYPNDPGNQVYTHCVRTKWPKEIVSELLYPSVQFEQQPLETEATFFTYPGQPSANPAFAGSSDKPLSTSHSLGTDGNLIVNLAINGTITPGDFVGVSNNFNNVSYTVQSGDTYNDVADGLAAAINANGTYRSIGITAGSFNNVVSMRTQNTGLAAGFAFFTNFGATEVLQLNSAVRQTQIATFSGPVSNGDTVTFIVNNPLWPSDGTRNFPYTASPGDTLDDFAASFASQINADTVCQKYQVTAVAAGPVLHLTSYSPDVQSFAYSTGSFVTMALSKIQNGNLDKSTFTYNSLGNVTSSIDPMGRSFSYIYDSNEIDLLEKREVRDGDDFLLGHWEYSGPAHLPTKFVDGGAHETNYEYNSSGQIIKITDADSSETKFEYTGTAVFNVGGSVTSSDVVTLKIIDPDIPGGDKDADYTVQPGDSLSDIAAGLAGVINGDSDFTSIGISASNSGPDLTVLSTSVNVTVYAPSISGGATETFGSVSFNFGYLTKIDGPLSGTDDVTTFSYDGFGRLFTQTDSEGYVLTFFYDDMNRLIRTEYPDGTSDKTIYDRLDPVLMTDRNGRTSQKAFDSLDQLVFEIDPLGRKTQYTWCSCGSLTSLTDANNNTTSWAHDLQGRVTQKIYADSSTVDYVYENRTSRLHSVEDSLGQIKTYSYYPDGRLFQVNYSDPVNATTASTFFWDYNFPRMTSCAKNGPGGVTRDNSYSYNSYVNAYTDTPIDGAGMLSLVETNAILNSDITYVYDNLGRVINRSIDGANNSIDWSYDEMSRVTNETNALGSFDYHYVDDTPGSSKGTTRLESIDYPNGQVTEFAWHDNAGDQRLEEIHNKKTSGGPTLSKFNYQYDPAGQITKWTQQQVGAPLVYNLGYDQAGQLTSARAGLGKSAPPYIHQFGYAYDPGANRISAVKSTGDVARISGSVTTSDVVSIIVNDASLPGGTKQIDYTVQGGDTLADIARELSAAITSDTDMQSSGINAFPVVAADSPSAIGAQIVLRSNSNEPTVFKGDVSGATESIETGAMLNGTMNAILGGSATASDVVTITVFDAALGGGQESENYTVQGGDTLEDVAAGLATAINGNTNMANIGVSAESHGDVLNISSRSVNETTYDKSFSGGATEIIDFRENRNGTQTAIIGGSVTSSDVLTLTFKDAGLSGGSQAINYTVQPGDTTSVIAAGLATNINASSPLQDQGITANSLGTVLNIVSVSPHLTTVAKSLSGGATETVSLAPSLNVTAFGHNNLNELNSIATGGVTAFEGSTNKAVSSVTVDSNDAFLPNAKHFCVIA